MSLVIWNLLLFQRSQLFISFYFMQFSYLTLLICWGKSHDFDVKAFLTTVINYKFIQGHFQTRNFNCTAAKVTLSEFQGKSASLFTFCWQKYFFAYCWQLNVFCFRFQRAEWPGFVVCSLEVSLRMISFRCLFGLPIWNFGRPMVKAYAGAH